jgi:hypothetical protein
MHTTVNLELGTGPIPRRGPPCTPEQARELLEGLRTAYQSLLPAERIVIRDIVAQFDANAIYAGNECKKPKAAGSCAESR